MKTPQRTSKGRYVNRYIRNIYRKPMHFFLWMLGYFRDHPFEIVPKGFSYPIPEKSLDPNKPWAQWIGHSTYLISVGGKHLLTDPIWSNYCSPVPFLGPKRKIKPAVAIKDLPHIDIVLLSHDHYDHLDRPSVEKLHERFPDILWIVPKGVKSWFEKQQIKRVVELSWGEEIVLDSAIKVTSVPAQHFSGRRSSNQNRTLWMGFVVENLLHSKVFYFVGDTGYNRFDFKSIGERFNQIDLSLIPIGSYSPRKFMAPVHIEPKDAVNIHMDVRSKFSLAMHWKTFRLSEEPMDQPPFDLYSSMKEKNLDPHSFLPINPGHKVNW